MWEILARLAAATLAGIVIGLNRDLRGKPAGVRTHALVTLGAAVVTTVAAESAASVQDAGNIGRVIQGIITGIGFLGAGVIMREAGGHVSGLTTAATIWVCAALGCVCGLGERGLVFTSVVLALFILLVGGPIERLAERIFKKGQS